MNTDTKVFGNSSPTLGAELRRVFGGDFNYCSGSLFRFPAQYVKEPEPSHVSHRPIQGSMPVPSVHLLNADCAVVADQLSSELEVEITPLIAYLLVGFSNKDSCFSPSLRAFDPAGEPLLSHSQFVLILFEEAGIAHLCALRGCQEGLATNIYAHRLIAGWQWFVRHIVAGEAYIPLACRGSADGDGFYVTLYWTRQSELKPADVLDRQSFPVKFPASLFQSKAIVSIPTLEARKACFVTPIEPSEKALVGSAESLYDILQYLRTNIGVFGEGDFEFREFIDLVKTRYGMAVGMISYYALFKSRVIEIATKTKPVFGFLKGLVVSQKAILKTLLPLHNYIVASLLKGVKAGFYPVFKEMGYMASNGG